MINGIKIRYGQINRIKEAGYKVIEPSLIGDQGVVLMEEDSESKELSRLLQLPDQEDYTD